MRRIETNDWWQELVQLKDELSLRELAEKFKVTPGAISAAFKREGITRRPAPPGPRARRKPRTQDELPPEPGEAAAAAAPEPRPGSKDALIEPHRHLLGKVPDPEVAELAGVAQRTIAHYRKLRGIPGYAGPRSHKGGGRKSKIDAYQHLLGVAHDREVALKAGVTVNAVRNYRTKRGIPAAPARAGEATGAVTTPESGPARTNGTTNGVHHAAWLVVVGDGADREQRVVVADSITDAARQAEAAGLGEVVALEYVARLV